MGWEGNGVFALRAEMAYLIRRAEGGVEGAGPEAGSRATGGQLERVGGIGDGGLWEGFGYQTGKLDSTRWPDGEPG